MAAQINNVEVMVESNDGYENVCILSELEMLAAYDELSQWVDDMESREAWWDHMDMHTPYH